MKRLKPHAGEFDAVAFRGMSGALVAPSVAMRLDKNLVFVRKGERNHSGYTVEGVTPSTYVIVDDFICTGGTIEAIRDEIARWCPEAKLVGICLYRKSRECPASLKNYAETFKAWVIGGQTPQKYVPKKEVAVKQP